MKAPAPTPLDERKFYTAIRELPSYIVDKMVFDKATSCWVMAVEQQPKSGIRVWTGKRTLLAHRFVYEQLMFPVPQRVVLTWLCGNKRCCNPEHMRRTNNSDVQKAAGSGQNVARMQLAKTHCPRGHAYDEANTQRYGTRRSCRACAKERLRNFYINRVQPLRARPRHQEQQCSAHP